MPRFPLRLETPVGVRYLEWSTIVDAPVTYGLTWNEFQRYAKQHIQGWSHDPRWKRRIARMRKTGVGWMDTGYKSAADVIRHNRAGEDGTTLTVDQIIDHYCVKRGETHPRPRGTFGRSEEPSNKRRVVIVFDGHAWFVRRLASLVHDLDRGEKIYTCDQPIGGQFATPGEAMGAATAWLDSHIGADQ